MVWRSTEPDDDTGKQKTQDCQNFDRGEYELSFSIYGHSEDIQEDDDDDNQAYPYGLVVLFVLIPELDDEGRGGDFGTECDCGVIPVVPAHGEPESFVGVASAVLRDGAGKGKPGSHLAKTLHHTKDSNSSKSITKEDRYGTSVRKSFANTEEETGTNGTAQGDELDVTGFEAVVFISIFGKQNNQTSPTLASRSHNARPARRYRKHRQPRQPQRRGSPRCL